MTFGRGAEYCRESGMEFIEIPSPYVIESGKERVKLVTDISELVSFLKPEILATINDHFRKVDTVIVDGSPLGLALAKFAGKKYIYVTNDTTALVGVHGIIEKKIAASLNSTLLNSAHSIIVPDFPPPLSITMLNLNSSLPLKFAGPFAKRVKQVRHKKKYLVVGNLEKQLKPYLAEGAIYGSKQDIRACYEDCEVVICHGGHTTMMEALSYGKPLVCVVDRDYCERYNNALILERKEVGVLIERNMLSKESLDASIGYASTLSKSRLELYRSTAQKLDPMKVLGAALSAI